MNDADIHSAWTSPANQIDPLTASRLTKSLARRLRRQRMVGLVWLVWTALLVIFITARTAWWVAHSEKFQAATDWILLPLILPLWFVLAFFWHSFLVRGNAAAKANRSIVDALRETLAENHASRTRHRVIAFLQLAFAISLPFMLHQLAATGKIEARDLGFMALLFAVALALGGGLVAERYFRVLLPERNRVETLLHSYEQSPSLERSNETC